MSGVPSSRSMAAPGPGDMPRSYPPPAPRGEADQQRLILHPAGSTPQGLSAVASQPQFQQPWLDKTPGHHDSLPGLVSYSPGKPWQQIQRQSQQQPQQHHHRMGAPQNHTMHQQSEGIAAAGGSSGDAGPPGLSWPARAAQRQQPPRPSWMATAEPHLVSTQAAIGRAGVARQPPPPPQQPSSHGVLQRQQLVQPTYQQGRSTVSAAVPAAVEQDVVPLHSHSSSSRPGPSAPQLSSRVVLGDADNNAPLPASLSYDPNGPWEDLFTIPLVSATTDYSSGLEEYLLGDYQVFIASNMHAAEAALALWYKDMRDQIVGLDFECRPERLAEGTGWHRSAQVREVLHQGGRPTGGRAYREWCTVIVNCKVKGEVTRISLVQLSTYRTVVLIRTCLMDFKLPNSIQQLLLDPSIQLAVCGWSGSDKQKYQATFQASPHAIVAQVRDIQSMARSAGYVKVGLKPMVQTLLHPCFSKGKTATMYNWESDTLLPPTQVRCAALDAICAEHIYRLLRIRLASLQRPPAKLLPLASSSQSVKSSGSDLLQPAQGDVRD